LKQLLLAVALVASFTGPASVQAQAPAPAQPAAAEAPKPNDYGDAKSWLCRPGRKGDACDVDMTATVVAADGKLTRETWAADPNAPIDCFYVYPTVSTDPGDNSDMTPDPAETNVVMQQFARFASKCRVYAPSYRQVTLAGLRKSLATGSTSFSLDRGLAYDDVRDAWNSYLKNDNQGRGVALISHSQGSFILIRLIHDEIDGKPIQSKLVSAILLGTTVAVEKGKDVGGSFKTVPICRKPAQLGCVVTYASFRSNIPPPANTLFGKVTEPNQAAACTNPVTLGEGSSELRSYLSTAGRTITGTSATQPWAGADKTIDTPWVSVPGLITAKCATNENATYLEVTVHGDPADPRIDDIVGDLGTPPRVLANWGLHLIDVNLAMGNLVDLVGVQAKAYASKR
jgi:hypothetical protein